MLCRYACRTVALATAITLNVPTWAQASPAGHRVPRQTAGVSTSGYPDAVDAADSIPSPLTLRAAQRLALTRSPVLAQARAEIEAGRNKAEYRNQLPDPALTLDAQNLPASTLELNQSGMSMLGIGVSQKFPPPGKLGLIRRRLEQDTNALRFRKLNLKAGIVRAVRRIWLELYYDDRVLAILAENRTLYRQAKQAALVRYRAGRGLAADVLEVQIAADKLIDREDRWRARRRQAQNRLAQWLALPSNDHFAVAQSFPHLPAVPPRSALLQGLVHHPAVAAQDDVIHAAQLDAAAARRDFYPSYELSASWAHRAAPFVRVANLVSVGVTMTMPLFPGRRQNARLQEREAKIDVARDQRDELLLGLRQQAQSRYADYDSLTHRIRLLRDKLLPEARQAAVASLSAMRTGNLPLTGALAAQRAVLDQTLRMWRLKTSRARVAADLDYLATTVTEDFHAH